MSYDDVVSDLVKIIPGLLEQAAIDRAEED